MNSQPPASASKKKPVSTGSALKVEVVSRLPRLPLSAVRCRRLLQRAATLAPADSDLRSVSSRAAPRTLTVLFAGDSRMRSLNARYRGVDATTDVLSFPAGGDGEHPCAQEEPYLGDMAISIPVARRQAVRHGHGVAKEIQLLLLHGFLHLLGYDHETDDGQMERAERRLRRRLGLPPRTVVPDGR